HGAYCLDTVLVVDAKPTSLASADDPPRRPTLVVGPNPSRGTAEITFTLPGRATVDLGVYDLAGRSIRRLVKHEPLVGGTYARAWDGAGDDGVPAAPGVYLVRLDTPAAQLTRAAVRMH